MVIFQVDAPAGNRCAMAARCPCRCQSDNLKETSEQDELHPIISTWRRESIRFYDYPNMTIRYPKPASSLEFWRFWGKLNAIELHRSPMVLLQLPVIRLTLILVKLVSCTCSPRSHHCSRNTEEALVGPATPMSPTNTPGEYAKSSPTSTRAKAGAPKVNLTP